MLRKYGPFLSWINITSASTFRSDAIAGLTGAVILLPQGVVFAMIAGLPPIYGLYSAMIIPVVAALTQSSYHLISGPTTAMSLVVYSTISAFAEAGTEAYIALVLSLTLMAGGIQFILGASRLGKLINFISHAVIVGFTAGAALLIATSQMKLILGLDIARGLSFYETWAVLVQNIRDTNLMVLWVGLGTLTIAVVIQVLSKRLPHLLIAMIGGSVIAYAMGGQQAGIETVGALPAGLPPVSNPFGSFADFQMLGPGAFAIALLGLIEAVAIGRAISVRSGQKINGNQEFLSQGISNMVGSFFSSYMSSGSFTRSAVNYQAGGATPLSAILAALFLLLILLFVAPLATYLPIPALGGIILLVAYKLIDVKHIREIIHDSKRETAVMVVTFLATLIFNLEFAIYVGVILSLIFKLLELKPRI